MGLSPGRPRRRNSGSLRHPHASEQRACHPPPGRWHAAQTTPRGPRPTRCYAGLWRVTLEKPPCAVSMANPTTPLAAGSYFSSQMSHSEMGSAAPIALGTPGPLPGCRSQPHRPQALSWSPCRGREESPPPPLGDRWRPARPPGPRHPVPRSLRLNAAGDQGLVVSCQLHFSGLWGDEAQPSRLKKQGQTKWLGRVCAAGWRPAALGSSPGLPPLRLRGGPTQGSRSPAPLTRSPREAGFVLTQAQGSEWTLHPRGLRAGPTPESQGQVPRGLANWGLPEGPPVPASPRPGRKAEFRAAGQNQPEPAGTSQNQSEPGATQVCPSQPAPPRIT